VDSSTSQMRGGEERGKDYFQFSDITRNEHLQIAGLTHSEKTLRNACRSAYLSKKVRGRGGGERKGMFR